MVDFGGNVRIDGIDGDGHVIDIVLDEFIDAIRQGEAVGGNTELDVGGFLRELAEGLEGAFGLASGIARPATPSTVIWGMEAATASVFLTA